MIANVGRFAVPDDRPLAVTVYRRLEPSTAGAAMETLERVATLVEAGKLERSEAIDVPARQRTDTATTAVADELRAGAKQLGVSLDPAMQTVERYNQLIETDEAVCVFPVVTLVVRDAEDDAVVAIAPVRTGETILPVSELIGALEERRSLR